MFFTTRKKEKKPMSTKALQRISLVLHKRFMKASARASMKSHFYRVSLDRGELAESIVQVKHMPIKSLPVE